MNDPLPNELAAASEESRAPAAPASDRPRESRASPRLLALVAVVAFVALGFAVWHWYDNRVRLDELTQNLARRLSEFETQAKESRLLADQAREATTAAQVKIGVLESRLAESQSQQIALEALYQELSRNRDEWGYAEVEQSLLIANQQLQLAGNVKAALIALQNAEARLQHMDRPQLIGLRKALASDIDRLRALPYVDMVGISIRLDNLISAVERLPLATEVRPPAPPLRQSAEQQGDAWLRFAREAWAELKELVRIQRVDKPEVPLLAPQQSYFLRENLKLRLIGARLALLGRDEESYKTDLETAREWLERYFDMRDRDVQHAAIVLRNLHSSEITIEVPDISATLTALRALRPAREPGAR